MNGQRQTHRARSKRTTVQAALAAYVERVTRFYPDEVMSVALYGSQARGDPKVESDIDVLVVVRRDTPVLRQALADLAWQVQFEHGVVISDIIRSAEQFNRMRANRFPFYQNVEREGVLLWKSTSEPMPVYAWRRPVRRESRRFRCPTHFTAEAGRAHVWGARARKTLSRFYHLNAVSVVV